MGRVGESDAGVKLLRILAVHLIRPKEPRCLEMPNALVVHQHTMLFVMSDCALASSTFA